MARRASPAAIGQNPFGESHASAGDSVYPGNDSVISEGIESGKFLSAEQKRDISATMPQGLSNGKARKSVGGDGCNFMNLQKDNSSIRWAGALLAVGALVMPIANILYVFIYGSPKGTGEAGKITVGDSAKHVIDNWELVANIWRIEVFATILIAVASLVLMTLQPSESKKFPSKIAWTFIAVGAILLLVMYTFMLGTFPAAAAAYAGEPTLFPAMNGAAVFLFNLGNLLTFIGFSGVFFGESSDGILPKWLAMFCAVLSLIFVAFAVAFFYNFANFKQFLFLGPVAMILYLVMAFYGFLLWKKD